MRKRSAEHDSVKLITISSRGAVIARTLILDRQKTAGTTDDNGNPNFLHSHCAFRLRPHLTRYGRVNPSCKKVTMYRDRRSV